MDVEVGLLSLPCELHAMMLVQLSWRDFASLRLANRPLADGAGLCMLERLKAAAAAYASPAYSKVLQHDKLASWPVRSGALAVLLPASEWAALVSTASPLLEFWLRHELVAPQPVYLQYLCAARPPDRAVGPRGDTSGSFYRPVVGPEQLAAWATLRQLHLRALLRYDAASLPGGGIRGVCEEVLALLRGRQHLDALDAGEPSPLDPPAARLLADALFTAALALHHSSGATPGAPSSAALALYRQCRALLRRAMDVWTSVDQPPGGLGKHSTQLAVCQALAGEAAAEESGGAPARALPLLEEAEAGLAELLPRVETSLGAEHPLASQTSLALGGVLLRRRQPRRALAYVQRAHDARRAALGALHADTCKAVLWLSGVLEQVDGAGAALAPFVHALRALILPCRRRGAPPPGPAGGGGEGGGESGGGAGAIVVDAAAVAVFARARHHQEFWDRFLRAAEHACAPRGDAPIRGDRGPADPAAAPLADEAAWLVSVLPWQRVTSTSVLAQCQADARASGVIRFWSLVAAKQGRPEPPRTAASLFFPLPPQYGQYLT